MSILKKSLFDKSTIGGIEVKNHFIRSATWENMATESGHMTESLYDIYEELSKNEIGLIITGYANIVPEEQPNPGMMGIYDDSFIGEYVKLTDIVHENGSKIVMQLAYGGTKTDFNVGERIIYAPSEVPEKGTGVVGKAMTKADIDYIVTAFAEAGRRAKEAGFDGIEIHGAHSYLINQFLSPYYNKRTDKYGGSLQNRMRLLLDIYSKTREFVGKDYPVFVKLTASDFFEGGLTFEDTKKICKILEEIGVYGIELSGNIHGKASSLVGKVFDGFEIQDEGYFLDYAVEMSSELSIPLITVGGFKDLDTIENIFNETGISYFALSRPLLAEPDLIKRWHSGDRSRAICIRCSKCRTENGNYCTVFKSR